jgi:hypothetical protein
MHDPEQQPVILSVVAARIFRSVLWDTPPRLAPRPGRFAANFAEHDPEQQLQQLVNLSEARDLSGRMKPHIMEITNRVAINLDTHP